MIRKYAVFSLEGAVCGISNEGIEYGDYTFNLFKTYQGIFNTRKECEKHIANTLLDYKQRIKDNKTRFIIQEVYCQSDDPIFGENQSN